MKKVLLSAAMIAVAACGVEAQTIVTPANPQGWAPNSLLGSGAVGITSTNPRGAGTGSLELTGTGAGDRTRFAYGTAAVGGFGKLNQLSTLSFDWFRASSSTTNAWNTPVFRLIVADPGQQLTYRELVWEYDYQFASGNNTAPTNQWIDDQNLLAGNWYIGGSNGPGCASLYGTCLKQGTNWGFSSDAYVYGISIGTGSGWVNSFAGFADDVRIGFGTQPVASFDFETSSTVVPEPSTYALMAAGLAGLLAVQRRRRRSV